MKKVPMQALFSSLLALLLPTNAGADSIDDYLRAEIKKRQIPGLAVAVVKNGEIIKLKGYGVASIEHNVAVTPDTVFDLASVTKSFTATAIMMLVEEGRIGLDHRITEYVPNAPAAWNDITVRHLLTHTAGFEAEFMPTLNGRWLSDYTTQEMFEAAIKLAPSAAPGERYRYSDTGYFLLGVIIEQVTGKRYAEFLSERMFKPLRMSSTTLLDQWAIIKNFSPGYAMWKGNLVRDRRYAQVELAPGYGILSTVKDLAKWEIALVSGKLIKHSTLEQMFTPARLNNGVYSNYGFGWSLDEVRRHRITEHAGGTGTIIFRLPDEKLTVIILTNLALGSSNNPRGIAHAAAAQYVPGLRLRTIRPEPDPDPDLTARLKELLLQIASGKVNSEILIAGVGEQRRRSVRFWVKDIESFTFVACEDVTERKLDRFGLRIAKVCYYHQTGAGEVRYYRFYFTPDGKVADFWSHTEPSRVEVAGRQLIAKPGASRYRRVIADRTLSDHRHFFPKERVKGAV